MGGREREGFELARRASREALASGDAGLALELAGTEATGETVAGDMRAGFVALDRALELAGGDERAGAGLVLESPYSFALALRAHCAGYMGKLGQARSDFERAVALARKHDDPEVESYALFLRGFLLAHLGEVEDPRADATNALELAERANVPFASSAAGSVLSLAHANAMSWDEALAQAERTLATTRRLRIALWTEPMLLATIARSRLELGEPEEALSAGEEAVGIMEARGLTTVALIAPIVLAKVLAETEGVAAANRIEGLLDRALEVARGSNARVIEPEIRRERATLARLRGDEDAAEREAQAAQRLTDEIFGTSERSGEAAIAE